MSYVVGIPRRRRGSNRIVRRRIRRARGRPAYFSFDAAAIKRIFSSPSARIFPASATSPGPARKTEARITQEDPQRFLHEELPDTTRMAPPRRRRNAVRAPRAESVRLQYCRLRVSHELHYGRPRVGTSGIKGIIEPNDPSPGGTRLRGFFVWETGGRQGSGVRGRGSGVTSFE